MSSSNDSGGFALLLFAVGPGAGIAIYASIQAKYRNAAARYKPDVSVKYTVTDLVQEDVKTGTHTNEDSSVAGRNDQNHDQRAAHIKVVKD